MVITADRQKRELSCSSAEAQASEDRRGEGEEERI
jgi:hypothetical protein